MTELLAGVVLFTGLVLVLVLLILAVHWWLAPRGSVALTINGQRSLTVAVGSRLEAVLAEAGIHLPAACGGRGTCGQCRLTVTAGGGTAVPVEEALLDRRELARGLRLACQVTVRGPLAVEVPAEFLGVRRWTCRVRSNHHVATLVKALVLDLPEGATLDFRAGAYLSLTCPPHRTPFTDIDVDPAYAEEWERRALRQLVASCDRPETRAYSIASYPGEAGGVRLLVRLATPPPAAAEGVPPGQVSSWIFALRPGDTVDVAGPYGSFCASDSEREMVFVGGGVGMAPLRSILLDQLLRVRTRRKLSYWYGARNLRELLLRDEFDRLAEQHGNFDWCPALSEPAPEDHWTGERGFIHEVLVRRHLATHPAPEQCEYYLCGPPLMVEAVRRALDAAGVGRDLIRFDDFGN